MPRARLTVTVPEETWIGAVSRAHPEARFRVLAAMPTGDTGVGLVQLAAPDLAAVVEDVRDAETVAGIDLLQGGEGEVLFQFETTEPTLLFPVRSSGVPLELPFDIRDGEAVWEVTATHDRLSELGDQLDAFGIRFRVDRVEHYIEPERMLTERQRRVVRAAVERGYYDTPRRCTLTELAEALGIAKSTCSETLHRAEGEIIKRFVEELREPFEG